MYNQITPNPTVKASPVCRKTLQGRSFKICAHCNTMAACNGQHICTSCNTTFPIKKNTNSKQGRSFKKCVDCDCMAGSNNQIQCKHCQSSNWTQCETTKRRNKTSSKRKSNSGNKNACVKKRKTSGKNISYKMMSVHVEGNALCETPHIDALVASPSNRDVGDKKKVEKAKRKAVKKAVKDKKKVEKAKRKAVKKAAKDKKKVEKAKRKAVKKAAKDKKKASFSAEDNEFFETTHTGALDDTTHDMLLDNMMKEISSSTTGQVENDMSGAGWLDDMIHDMVTKEMVDEFRPTTTKKSVPDHDLWSNI